jgi:hypothetical protein
MEIEASVQELVEVIFLKNRDDSKIYMNLPYGESGIRNTHDLFIFLIDLLSKGLVLLYGDENKSVTLDCLNFENLNYVKRKLLNAGIQLDIQTKEAINMGVPVRPCIIKSDDNDELENYCLRLVSQHMEYNVSFKLIRI